MSIQKWQCDGALDTTARVIAPVAVAPGSRASTEADIENYVTEVLERPMHSTLASRTALVEFLKSL